MFIWSTFRLKFRSRGISVLCLWISYVFQNQVHRPFLSGLWYKCLGKRETAKQNLYFENFHFFQNRCLVQWCKAPLVMLAVWFESCEAHPFCKNISESFGSWKSFCLVGGQMDGWLDFFAISHSITSQSVFCCGFNSLLDLSFIFYFN